MKKSLIALAVAGVISAPAFAATSNVDIYGIMNVALQDTDRDGVGTQVTDNYSRIGFKGSEDLGGGLKAVWQIESQLSAGGADGVGGTQNLAGRNTFIGLAGGFGTFLIGRHDTPYKIATGKYDIFADTIADYNLGRLDSVALLNATHDYRSPSAIAYISPSFSGLSFAAAVISTNTPPPGNLDDEETVDAYSLAAMYGNGPLTVDVAFQDVTADLDPAALGKQDSTAWKIGAGYKLGDTKFGFVYEDIDQDNADRDSWLINVAHGMGPITLKAMYGQVDATAVPGTSGEDQDMWALGADYAMSKRTTAYVAYGVGDDDYRDDVGGWNIGMKHSF